MQKYTYHWEVKDLLTQFLQAFDGAIVKRYNNQRIAGNNVAVRYVYAPKQRVLHDLVNKAQHITLPAVAFWITSINRDSSRVFNKTQGQYRTNNDTSKSAYILQPVPVNIEVSVSVLTRFQTDMDQILSNFVPYSDPYFIISWSRDGMPNLEIRSEVLWSGSLNMTYPTEQQSNQPTRVTCDTSFTIKGWLFKYDSDPVGRIFKIENNFYPVSGTPTLQNIDELVNPTLTETFIISAIPEIPYANRWIAPVSLSGSVELYGNQYDFTTAVYLSGNNNMFSGATTVSPFVSSSSLSASYPSLTGVIPAVSYYINSNNKMTVFYPKPLSAGFFDIVVVNDAGYTKLSTGSYNTNLTAQYPYTLGIQVVDPSIPVDTIRTSLTATSSIAAYDLAAPNSWVQVQGGEYAALQNTVLGVSAFGLNDTQIRSPATANTFSGAFTVVMPPSSQFVMPSNTYLVGFVSRMGSTNTAVVAYPMISDSYLGTYNSVGSAAFTTPGSVQNVYFVRKTPTSSLSAQGFVGYAGNNTSNYAYLATPGGLPQGIAAFAITVIAPGSYSASAPGSWTSYNPNTPMFQILGTTTKGW